MNRNSANNPLSVQVKPKVELPARHHALTPLQEILGHGLQMPGITARTACRACDDQVVIFSELSRRSCSLSTASNKARMFRPPNPRAPLR